ncbi:ArsR/SmtB family transcription factor [Catellatospora bangladeshensis]|uniref:HTH arsR-type domain-containing protein n=1 Tax=Catellatospora bangladeshensis TaxID=310355 RepID=A0A8J3NGG9_9ACTN|nr:winged helix-turn-helix domain-containing protein [Catellatospora bangladeshensis]GIF78658.1 hypothetical protein Cba03nite_00070 [Catellatospora bangladeshensis]
MSRILFGVRDAADIRFCISPLWETVRGRYVLGNSDRFPVHLPWLRWARQVRPDPAAADGLALLSELTRAHGYLPDFLTPAPPGPLGELDDELAVVAATPADVLHADLAATTEKLPLGPRTTALLDDPPRLLDELVAGAREWHRVAVAPYWARMRARAVGSVWEDGPAADGALAALFGASRARLLDILRQPATTSELARRTGMAAGTVSEHLGVMHAAGLLARSRHGRTVLYVATAAGQSLLDARDRPGPG